MDGKMSVVRTLLVALGAIDIGLAYLLFTNQQYFSLIATLGLFALTGIGLFLLIATWAIRRMNSVAMLAAAALASAALIAYEAVFDITPLPVFLAIAYSCIFVFAAAIASVLAFYATSGSMKKSKGIEFYLTSLIVVVVVAALSFTIMYVVNPVSIPPLDELVYSYYSSYLFVHGQNPYVVGMAYINNLYNFVPTPQLNGLYENRYAYPALSFISLSFVPLLGLKALGDSSAQSFGIYTVISVFINVLTAFILYYKSGFGRKALLASGVWLVISFGIFYDPIHSIALLFATMAYLERHRHMLSAALLGLAASMSQLAWFLLPFFYILALNEEGRSVAVKEIIVSFAVFALINSYYVMIVPAAFFNSVFGIFGLQTLAPYGSNLMQFATSFYMLPYRYATFASVTVFLFLMALFYLYCKSLKPLLAAATMAVFLFSWRNLGEYSVAVLPLAIAVYYCPNRLDRNDSDRLKGKMPILYGIIVLSLLLLPVAMYAHSAYLSEQHTAINSLMPRVYVQYTNAGAAFSLLGFNANVSNNEQAGKNVSFFMVSRSPNTASYILGKNLMMLGPRSNYTYMINYTLPRINNGTKLFVTMFTEDYIVSRSVNITVRVPPVGQNRTQHQ